MRVTTTVSRSLWQRSPRSRETQLRARLQATSIAAATLALLGCGGTDAHDRASSSATPPSRLDEGPGPTRLRAQPSVAPPRPALPGDEIEPHLDASGTRPARPDPRSRPARCLRRRPTVGRSARRPHNSSRAAGGWIQAKVAWWMDQHPGRPEDRSAPPRSAFFGTGARHHRGSELRSQPDRADARRSAGAGMLGGRRRGGTSCPDLDLPGEALVGLGHVRRLWHIGRPTSRMRNQRSSSGNHLARVERRRDHAGLP